ncbi:hypothetical protein U9M48_041034 [Paspalum notatum var. saurae]|uniref:Uncharacterized protein n=1 Tax=Paspalum notatum var. saurae TaxID=547442 RepID=A0AAQ3UPN3_PASNO
MQSLPLPTSNCEMDRSGIPLFGLFWYNFGCSHMSRLPLAMKSKTMALNSLFSKSAVEHMVTAFIRLRWRVFLSTSHSIRKLFSEPCSSRWNTLMATRSVSNSNLPMCDKDPRSGTGPSSKLLERSIDRSFDALANDAGMDPSIKLSDMRKTSRFGNENSSPDGMLPERLLSASPRNRRIGILWNSGIGPENKFIVRSTITSIIPDNLFIVRFSTVSDELVARECGMPPPRLLYARST